MTSEKDIDLGLPVVKIRAYIFKFCLCFQCNKIDCLQNVCMPMGLYINGRIHNDHMGA